MNQQAIEADRKANEMLAALQQGNTKNKAPENELQSDSKEVEQAPAKQEAKQENRKLVEDDPWKTRFSVLRGKYEAEVPRLFRELKEEKAKQAELQREIAELKSKTESEKPTQESEKLQALREEYGDELINGINDLISEKTPQPQQAEQPQDSEQTDQEGLSAFAYDYIVNQVGGQTEFDRLDALPAFNQWLGELDPLYGIARREVMQNMAFQGKLNETANFYITWRNQHEKGNAAANANPLEEHVQPGRSRASSTPEPTKQVWSRAEWDAKWKEITIDPKYRTTEGRKEAAAIEKELQLAGMEGRIR